MAQITLTMIVKDEADRLPGALASAEGVADRIVIVDTGSSDDTIQIARDAGATVIEHPFVDFSDARNAALPHVETPWLVFLDADERFGPGAAEAIRAAVAEGGFDCGMVPYHNASRDDASIGEVLSGAARLAEPVVLPRLFRRTEGFRWEGAVHESPRSWLAAGRRFRDVEAPIAHYGATPERIAARGKNSRNLQLLRQRVAANPRDVFGLVYLAREEIRAGDNDAARAAIGQAWAVVAEDETQRGEVATLATMRAWDQIQRGDDQAAMQTLSAAAEWGAVHPNMFLLQGMALENLAAALPESHREEALRKAVGVLALCRDFEGKRFTEEVIAGATSWAADIRQGACLLALGETAAALPVWRRAFSARPDIEEVRLGLAESLVEVDAAEALSVLGPARTGAGIDGWLLAAAAHEARGELREMAVSLMEAVQHVRTGFRARHRRVLLDELVALLGILQGDPRPGRGAIGALAGLMSGYPPEPGTQHPAPAGSATARRLGHVLRYLQHRGEARLIAALGEPPAENLFPGIGAVIAELA